MVRVTHWGSELISNTHNPDQSASDTNLIYNSVLYELSKLYLPCDELPVTHDFY